MSVEPKTIVLFRIDRAKTDRQVTAVFPLDDEGDGMMSCYAHIGQHGGCSRAWMHSKTRPATPAEYADLKRELERAPYHYNFDIRQRTPRR